MQIRRLSIIEKKCLVDFNIRFHTMEGRSTTILIGENGTGKSTMMESILEILMSFDSPSIEKQIDYDYILEYEYAQKNISITKSGHDYRFCVDGDTFEGSYASVRRWISSQRLFPKRVIAFYSGANNKLEPAIKKMNAQYRKQYLRTMAGAFADMADDTTTEIPATPIKKFNFCDEHLVPIYLSAILCGRDSYEKRYLVNECNFAEIDRVRMIINLDKVEKFFGFDRFEDERPYNLFFTTDYVEHQFTDILRRGWQFAADGKGYFELRGIQELEMDARNILDFFEVLYDLFDAKYEAYVNIGNDTVSAYDMSEGQRQLIKVLGMLGICKREDCLILMDEPDAHMNPKWKYGLKNIMDECLEEATNAQAIVATHDPLVINGVPKEFIRIFAYNDALRRNNGFYITQVVEPTEDTIGMGIDGLLQSEYYGLYTTLDTKTQEKLEEKRNLMVKRKEGTITEDEMLQLLRLTDELEQMDFSRNIPTDNYFDDFVIAMHEAYQGRPRAALTQEEIAERNQRAREIAERLIDQ